MKFPSLPKLSQADLQNGSLVDKLNQWAYRIEELANNITFGDNFEQIVVTKQGYLNAPLEVPVNALSSSKYRVELVSMSCTTANVTLVGPRIDWTIRNSTVSVTPRVQMFNWLGDGEPPRVDYLGVEFTVQILGVD